MLDLKLHYTFKKRYNDHQKQHNILAQEIAQDLNQIIPLLVTPVTNNSQQQVLLYGDHHALNLVALSFMGKAQKIVYADIVGSQDVKEIEQNSLPLYYQNLNCIVTLLELNFSNDLQQTLRAYYDALKPGGILMAALYGAGSLWQLRQAMMKVDEMNFGGIRNPFLPLPDPASIITYAKSSGFSEIVLEQELYRIQYNDVSQLLDDLRKTGNSNCLRLRSQFHLTKKYLIDLASCYPKEHHSIIADYNILILTCRCKPH